MKSRLLYFLLIIPLSGFITYHLYANFYMPTYYLERALDAMKKNNQLLDAFYNNNAPEILRMLKQDPQLVNALIRWEYQTPLIVTILFNTDEGSLDTVLTAILKNPKLDINKKIPGGKTALMFAVQYITARSLQGKAPATVQLLLEHGADPWIADDDGNTALSLVYQLYYARIQSQRYASDNGGCISNQSSIEIDDYNEIIKLLLTSMARKQPQETKKIIDHVRNQYTKELQAIMHEMDID